MVELFVEGDIGRQRQRVWRVTVQQVLGVLASRLFVIVDNRSGLGTAIFERCRIYFRALVLDLKLALREGASIRAISATVSAWMESVFFVAMNHDLADLEDGKRVEIFIEQ